MQQTNFADKVMVIFFDYKDVIYQHIVSPKTIVNSEYYVPILKI